MNQVCKCFLWRFNLFLLFKYIDINWHGIGMNFIDKKMFDLIIQIRELDETIDVEVQKFQNVFSNFSPPSLLPIFPIVHSK